MDTTISQQIHHESIIIDGLNASWFLEPQVLHNLHRGGITAVNATIAAWHNPTETLAMLGDVYALFAQHTDLIIPVHTTADIATAHRTQRTGMILGFQDTSPIGDNARLLAVYHQLGVRIIQLTYNHPNLVGTGCMAPEDTGLTAFGQTVVAEMNRLGILVDLSHCGQRTTLDAVAASAQPVAITHANPKALCDVPRNKTDEAFKAVAARGGVVGAVVFPLMLTGRFDATLDDYIRTIDYLVNLVGIDHVGLGPDFMEHMPREVAMQVLKGLPPEMMEAFLNAPPTVGFASIAECAQVTQALVVRGYTRAQVQQILGGNWLRLYQTVWHA